MESFNQLVEKRYSCRRYDKERAVSQQTIAEVLEDARLAPSACNKQPWQFWVVVNDKKAREAVLASYSRDWIASAAAFIVCIGVEEEGWMRPFDGHSHIDVDLAIAAEHICLSATEHGLGSCWICNFDPDVLRRGLGITEGLRPVAIIPLGYPSEEQSVPEKKRKAAEEITKWLG